MGWHDQSGLRGFRRRFLGSEDVFTRIGRGELGGKAAGLQLIQECVLHEFPCERFPDVEITIPTLTVLATDLFEHFVERNKLWTVLDDRLPDDRIGQAFQRAELPADVVGDLRALITQTHSPLAVRSSSLLEDSLEHPFAGVYGTKMIPNNQFEPSVRFSHFAEAIKFVWATTVFRGARDYADSLGREIRDERMAVVVQEVVGSRFGDRFYPHVSGVARSWNHYPAIGSRPEDGVVNLALGLGKQIVDGGLSWTYCPARPRAPAPFNDVRDLLQNVQRHFWSVNMGRPPLPDPIRETEFLLRAGLESAEEDGSLIHLASTYDSDSDVVRPGTRLPGARVLDFASLLRFGELPLNEIVVELLRRSEDVLGHAVEIEFALTLGRKTPKPARFGVLQLRPMRVSDDQVELDPAELEAEDRLLGSRLVLGNGELRDICDVVFIRPESFDTSATREIALEIAKLNRALLDQHRSYLLIGFGRWGSSDPWLGIPVEWSQICGARVVVEATLPDMNPDFSQGSHFFHNMISQRTLYLSIPHHGPYPIDWEWLQAQVAVQETRFVRHIRTEQPLLVKVDSRQGLGVIRRHGG